MDCSQDPAVGMSHGIERNRRVGGGGAVEMRESPLEERDDVGPIMNCSGPESLVLEGCSDGEGELTLNKRRAHG